MVLSHCPAQFARPDIPAVRNLLFDILPLYGSEHLCSFHQMDSNLVMNVSVFVGTQQFRMLMGEAMQCTYNRAE